jgi:uroporphyrinogen decarboxylase
MKKSLARNLYKEDINILHTMSPRERVLASLKREPVDRISYCEHLADPGVVIKAAGGIDKLTSNQEILRDASSIPLDRTIKDLEKRKVKPQDMESGLNPFGGTAMLLEPEISRFLHRDNITYWDTLVPFKAGMPYLLDPITFPKLSWNADGILKSRKDLDKMVFHETDEVLARAEKFLAHKGDFAACAMVWLGIDPTWHSMGFSTFCTKLAEDPELVEEVLSRISNWSARVVEELCKMDFDFIWAADDIAFRNAPFFSPRMYREILLPHTCKVAEKITLPWIYHSDGNLLPIMDDLLSQGMNAIHPLEPGSMDLVELKKRYGHRVALVGNIDIDLLSRGTPQKIKEQVKDRIKVLGPGYGYILCSSNSITPACLPENVKAMVEALLEYGQYPLKI